MSEDEIDVRETILLGRSKPMPFTTITVTGSANHREGGKNQNQTLDIGVNTQRPIAKLAPKNSVCESESTDRVREKMRKRERKQMCGDVHRQSASIAST